MAAAVHPVAALADLLVAEGHDDAVVVLGVLQIVLGQHRIAGGLRIARERHILLGDMRRRAADLHVRPVLSKLRVSGFWPLRLLLYGRGPRRFCCPCLIGSVLGRD